MARSDKEYNHSDKIAQAVNQVFALVQDINRKTEFCAFLSYAGHTNQIDVHITKSKEAYGEDVSNRVTIYLSGHNTDEETLEQLEKMDKTLSAIVNEYGVKTPHFEL